MFLMPAFTLLRHECQDLLGPVRWKCMCTQPRPRFILSTERVFCGMESEPMLSPREKSPLPGKFSPEEDRTRDAARSRTASPTHYQRAIPAPSSSR